MATSKVLMVIPDEDFDPTESGVVWCALKAAGHTMTAATASGARGTADSITLTGKGLPRFARGMLRCAPENAALYAKMEQDPAFVAPLMWSDVAPEAFDALVLPGGHAPKMKPYLESADVQRIVRSFFERQAPVAAVCHGVLAVARTQASGGRSVLFGKKTTGLTNLQEKAAVWMTQRALGNHYRTYAKTVQDEVSAVLESPAHFLTGSVIPRDGTAANPDVGFVVRDGHYLSARYPGDVHRWAKTFAGMLSQH